MPPTTSPRKPDTKNISFQVNYPNMQTDDLEEMSEDED